MNYAIEKLQDELNLLIDDARFSDGEEFEMLKGRMDDCSNAIEVLINVSIQIEIKNIKSTSNLDTSVSNRRCMYCESEIPQDEHIVLCKKCTE